MFNSASFSSRGSWSERASVSPKEHGRRDTSRSARPAQKEKEEYGRLMSVVGEIEQQVRILQGRHDSLCQDHMALKADMRTMQHSMGNGSSPYSQPSTKQASVMKGSSSASARSRQEQHGSPVRDTRQEQHGSQNQICDSPSHRQRRSPKDHPKEWGSYDSGAPLQEASSQRHRREPPQRSIASSAERSGRSSRSSPATSSPDPTISAQSRSQSRSATDQSIGPPLRRPVTQSRSQSPVTSPGTSVERGGFPRAGRTMDFPQPNLYQLAKPLLEQKDTQNEEALRMIRLLLKTAREPPNSWTGPGTPLGTAVMTGRVDFSRLLLRARADANEQDAKGVSPLHVATFDGNLELCRLLVMARADVNAHDRHGQSPLFFTPTADVTKLLVEHSADVRMLNRKGQSALHLASRAGLEDVAIWLESRVSESLIALRDEHGLSASEYMLMEAKSRESKKVHEADSKHGKGTWRGSHGPIAQEARANRQLAKAKAKTCPTGHGASRDRAPSSSAERCPIRAAHLAAVQFAVPKPTRREHHSRREAEATVESKRPRDWTKRSRIAQETPAAEEQLSRTAPAGPMPGSVQSSETGISLRLSTGTPVQGSASAKPSRGREANAQLSHTAPAGPSQSAWQDSAETAQKPPRAWTRRGREGASDDTFQQYHHSHCDSGAVQRTPDQGSRRRRQQEAMHDGRQPEHSEQQMQQVVLEAAAAVATAALATAAELELEGSDFARMQQQGMPRSATPVDDDFELQEHPSLTRRRIEAAEAEDVAKLSTAEVAPHSSGDEQGTW